ncbi:DOMON domain-containing protein [Ekhidna sp.]|uniref:DOMON domain-containing protein n=1 Tax=Ekhidna sp. TaxID=2608089 RepID=UPI003BA9FA45
MIDHIISNMKYLAVTVVGWMSVLNADIAQKFNSVERNGMKVAWEILGDRIFFKISAPTTGWIAIGLNESKELTGTYLIMGRVKNGNPEVIEHRTLCPGNYRSFENLGASTTIQLISGGQSRLSTWLGFSIPINKFSDYHKDVLASDGLNMLMAFSRHDDFMHHSIMRTSVWVNFN